MRTFLDVCIYIKLECTILEDLMLCLLRLDAITIMIRNRSACRPGAKYPASRISLLLLCVHRSERFEGLNFSAHFQYHQFSVKSIELKTPP